MKQSTWLVEIRVKDWIHVPDGQPRVIAYEQVQACTELEARHVGHDIFIERTKYEPKSKALMRRLNLGSLDVCAPDAVEL